MNTTDTSESALAAALATATAEGREVHSIKDLLCDACGVNLATREGYCAGCDTEVSTHYDATAAAHSMSTDDGVRFGFGDAEGENYLQGLRS